MASLLGHVSVLDVDAVVISHRHPDHLLDLYPFFYARLFHPERPVGLPLFLPPGAFGHIEALLSDQGGEELARVFDVHEIEPGGSFEVGPFRFSTAPMEHPVPTLGMRIEADGSALAYSADTGPSEDLVALAHGADVLLCEATWLDVPEGAPPIHLSAGQAGAHAESAEAGRLLLTHVRWAPNEQAGVERAAAEFHGSVELAARDLRLDL